MRSIHERPAEVAPRRVPGHWEADLIKGARNASSVGTPIERKSRYVVLAGFTRRLRDVPEPLRKTLTYDQGREMALHQTLTQRLAIEVFFADAHSPWQRGSIENVNGLLREYLPKGNDLSQYSQAYLNAIATSLNNRPRKVLDFQTPAEVFAQDLMRANQSVALQI